MSDIVLTVNKTLERAKMDSLLTALSFWPLLALIAFIFKRLTLKQALKFELNEK